MAVIHRTTLVPGKLDLLAGWLPAQNWYIKTAAARPELSKAGGFRLDDPDGEVGIEFMIVLDESAGAGKAAAYLVPMTYRGSPLEDGSDALIGTTEHGVLGTRWIYDGTSDLVLLTQLGELIQGRAEAQAQSETNVPDPTVLSSPLAMAAGDGLHFHFTRLLTPAGGAPAEPGQVTGLWTRPDGAGVRSVFVTSERVPA